MRYPLEERSLDFGVAVIKLVQNVGQALTPRSRGQLVSSATSIGANIAEARSAQSRADFISKMEIALKEARETDYWLKILHRLADPPAAEGITLLRECYEITAMLVASVKTAKANGLGRDGDARGSDGSGERRASR